MFFVIHQFNQNMFSIVHDRPNIFLEVQTASSSKYEKTLLWLVKELRDKGRQTPKTIFFTRCDWYSVVKLYKSLQS